MRKEEGLYTSLHHKVVGGVLLTFLFFLSVPLLGGGGIRVGVLKVHPALNFSLGYDSNVYMTYLSSPPSDFFVNTGIGLNVELPIITHSFTFGGNFSYLNFFKETKQNNLSYTLFGDLALKFVGGLSIDLSNEFRNTREPILGNYIAVSSRLPHYYNKLIPRIDYQIPSGAIDTFFEFSWEMDSFPTLTAYDRDLYGGRAGVVYRFLPKTGIYFNVKGIFLNKNLTSGGQKANKVKSEIGLNGLITPKLSATLGFGWDYGKYTGGVLENEPLVRLVLNEKFSSLTKLSVSFLRMSSDVVFASFYLVNAFDLNLWRALTPSLSATVKGRWWRLDYYPTGQVDNNYQASLKVGYISLVLRWLKASFDYTFHRRDSTSQAFRFTDHKVALNLNISW